LDAEIGLGTLFSSSILQEMHVLRIEVLASGDGRLAAVRGDWRAARVEEGESR